MSIENECSQRGLRKSSPKIAAESDHSEVEARRAQESARSHILIEERRSQGD
jgi:hypothetical protein